LRWLLDVGRNSAARTTLSLLVLLQKLWVAASQGGCAMLLFMSTAC
jgi:hypothetical protein